MKKITILVASILLFANAIFAQVKIDFVENPKPHVLTDSLKKYSAVYIIKDKKYEYQFNKKQGTVVMIVTNHFIVKVNDDKGIEQFNTFSFGMGENEFLTMKARSIQPDGKVISVTFDKIKEKTEEDGSKVKLIAVEGLEKGSEVEILIVEKVQMREFGSIDFQFTFPIMEANFYLETPKNLYLKQKGIMVLQRQKILQ